MTVSEQFKQELQREDLDNHSLARALKLALTEMIELNITTWVVPVESGSLAGDPIPGYRMKTHINIVDGDINNEIGSPFIAGGPYAELRDFHLQQVAESRMILQQNLETVQQLFTVLVGTVQKLSATKRGEGSSGLALPPGSM